jgi:hypothetical protein
MHDDRGGGAADRAVALEEGEVQVGILAPRPRGARIPTCTSPSSSARRRTMALAVTNSAVSRPWVMRAWSVGGPSTGTTTRPLSAISPGSSAARASASQRASGTVSSSVKAITGAWAARQPRLRAAAGPRLPSGRR